MFIVTGEEKSKAPEERHILHGGPPEECRSYGAGESHRITASYKYFAPLELNRDCASVRYSG